MRLLSCSVLALACTISTFSQTPPASNRTQTDGTTARAWSHLAQVSAQTLKRATADQVEAPEAMQTLPELSFADFFAPIGPQGLEYSDKIRALAGQRVRVRGFMVQVTDRVPGLFLFTPMPVKINTRADCNENDPPPTMIHVLVPGATKALPFVPGQRFLSGLLEIGARHEADDRISVARLTLDESARAALFGTPAETATPAVK